MDCGQNRMVWPFKWNLFSNTFKWWVLFLREYYKQVNAVNNNNNNNDKNNKRITMIMIVFIAYIYPNCLRAARVFIIVENASRRKSSHKAWTQKMPQSVENSTADMDSVFPAAEGLTHDLTFYRLCKNQHGAPRKCLHTLKFLDKTTGVFFSFWS